MVTIKKLSVLIIGSGKLSEHLCQNLEENYTLICRSKIKNVDIKNQIQLSNYNELKTILKNIYANKLIISGYPMGGSFSDNISYLKNTLNGIVLNQNNFDEIIFISSIAAKPIHNYHSIEHNLNYKRSAYAFGKLEAENYLLKFIKIDKLRIIRLPLIEYDNKRKDYFLIFNILKLNFCFCNPNRQIPIISIKQACNVILASQKIEYLNLSNREYLKECGFRNLIFIPKCFTYIMCLSLSFYFKRLKYPETLWPKFSKWY